MTNLFKKTFSKYTGLLIRMDDICENMNWKLMDKCESLFDKYEIKPLMGVILNQDPDLLKHSRNNEFWEKSKQLEKQRLGNSNAWLSSSLYSKV